MPALLRKALAEFIGTGVFLTAIVGVNFATTPTVLATAVLATALGLMVLLTGETSGGHLNPAVTLFFAAKKALSWGDAVVYIIAQILGGIVGGQLGGLIHGGNVWHVNNISIQNGQVLSEIVATTGLVWLIGYLASRDRGNIIPLVVGLWVFSAANFTNSGASANPAVTIARMFVGGNPAVGVEQGFYWILAEVAGVLIAMLALMFVTPVAAKKKSKK